VCSESLVGVSGTVCGKLGVAGDVTYTVAFDLIKDLSIKLMYSKNGHNIIIPPVLCNQSKVNHQYGEK
jgi:hypothetical protein